jgi:hypothetical protein
MSYTALDQVESYLQRYVVYPNEHAPLWIPHTYLMGLWDITGPLPSPNRGGRLHWLHWLQH